MSLNDFQLLSKVGQGHFSTVYKVKRLHDNHIYALKQVKLADLSQKQINQSINQVRILASIRHPNIIGYKQAFYDLQTKSLCIVMQYADGGDLEQKITDHRNKGLYLKEDYIWDVFGQMLSGICKLHDLGILHRDIKSANVYLMRSGIVKIGDLNVSKVVRKNGMCETQTGAPYYASPEVWRDEAYDSKSDSWSLGCVLYELINLKLPFRARDMEGLYRKVNRGYYPRINKSYSEELSQVVKWLLKIQPDERKNVRQLLDMTIVGKNIKKSRDTDLQQKSVLLRTIKPGKNISYIGQKLPLPNYSPLRFKQHSLSLGGNQLRKHRNKSIGVNNSTNLSLRSSLPPVNTSTNSTNMHVKRQSRLINLSNIINSNIHSPKRQVSSQKTNPRYKKAHSRIFK